MESHPPNMFSFESHVQLLSIFAMISPGVFLVISLVIRAMNYFQLKTPKWVNFLNHDVMREYLIARDDREYENGHADPPKSSEYKTFVMIAYYTYLLLSISVAILLWKSARMRCVTRIVMWIICVGILSLTGLTLIEPMKSIHLLEIGLAIVFIKVSIIYSVYTLVIVICLIFKIKLDET